MRDHVRLNGEAVIVRPAGLEDCSAVLELLGAARSEHAVTAEQVEDLERLVQSAPGALLIAELDGVLVGALIAAWDGWRGNMYRLAVCPEQRRAGIAMKLVRAGEAYLMSRGARRVTALVAYEDPTAAAFWDAAGYLQDTDIGRRVRNL